MARRDKLFITGFVVVTLFFFGGWSLTAQTAANDEAQIRAAYQHFMEAFNRKDVLTIMAFYVRGPELFVFDVTPPRQHVGWEDYKRDWEDLFAAFPGPLHQDMSDLSIAGDGKLAFSHFIVGGFFTRSDGSRLTVAVRSTDVLRKVNGKWLIVQEHVSVPVDLDAGKADLLSKP